MPAAYMHTLALHVVTVSLVSVRRSIDHNGDSSSIGWSDDTYVPPEDTTGGGGGANSNKSGSSSSSSMGVIGIAVGAAGAALAVFAITAFVLYRYESSNSRPFTLSLLTALLYSSSLLLPHLRSLTLYHLHIISSASHSPSPLLPSAFTPCPFSLSLCQH
jgi:hypothetical protein